MARHPFQSPLGTVVSIRLLVSVALALTLLVASSLASPLAGAQTLSVLYSLTGNTDGQQPGWGVIRDSAGNLYGTTQFGGTRNWGTLFKLTPT